MSRIRIVVADQGEAIFYDITSLKARPVEVVRMSDTAARWLPREQQQQQAQLGDDQEARRRRAATFARAIAERLDADRRARAFQQLIVVASAPFRSVMRTELTDATKACIVYEVPRDLVHSHVEVLRDYLPECAQELKSA